ncbi:MAG TPA: hypothetical protein HA224_00170 [Nanoarchaeota archaeon]|nr:hypothetical protein [Nanoarchaeota archaeon]
MPDEIIERHVDLIKKAKKEVALADHLLYVTYPMIKEMKFLLAISEHLINSCTNALEALLEFEKKYKRIAPFSTNFSVMANTYKEKVAPFYNLDPKFYRLLRKLDEIRQLGVNSPVKFQRGEKYILASEDFKLTILDADAIKRYNNIAKRFIENVDVILSKA